MLKKLMRKCGENNKIIYDNQFEWTEKGEKKEKEDIK